MKLNIVLQGIKNSLSLTDEEKEIIDSLELEYRDWSKSLLTDERHLIRKYTFNSYDNEKPNRFFERLNRALRGRYVGSDKDKLLKYGKIISRAVCRHSLEQDIICYRGVDEDFVENLPVGSQFFFDQFISTSVVKSGALKKRYKYVIIVPKGAKGAYLEGVTLAHGQYEFLLDYSCEFKLLAKNRRTVYLEVIV